MENVTGGQAPCHIKTGTKHHDEVGHYECFCGATK